MHTEILFDVIRALPYTSLPHLLPVSKRINKIISLCFPEEVRAFSILLRQLQEFDPPHEVIGRILAVKEELRLSILNRLLAQMSFEDVVDAYGHPLCPLFAKEALKKRIKRIM